jgi:hypothetical protein
MTTPVIIFVFGFRTHVGGGKTTSLALGKKKKKKKAQCRLARYAYVRRNRLQGNSER